MYGVVRGCVFGIESFECLVKMVKDQWMYDSIMYEEVDMS